jgi:hypothetical protein
MGAVSTLLVPLFTTVPGQFVEALEKTGRMKNFRKI